MIAHSLKKRIRRTVPARPAIIFLRALLRCKNRRLTSSRHPEAGETPPVYLSANVPGGDEHNSTLEARYAGRIRRTP